jgi:hypothetical protein
MESLTSPMHILNTACPGLVGKRKIPAAQVRNTAHIKNLRTVLARDGSAPTDEEPLAAALQPFCRRRSGSRSWVMARGGGWAQGVDWRIYGFAGFIRPGDEMQAEAGCFAPDGDGWARRRARRKCRLQSVAAVLSDAVSHTTNVCSGRPVPVRAV